MAKRTTTHRAASRNAERRSNVRRAWIIFGTLGVALVGLFLLTSGILVRHPAPAEEDHPHIAAAHGGTLVSVGDGQDHYHVEAVMTRSGLLRLYTYAHDAAQVIEVDAEASTAQLRAAGGAETVAVKLRAVPQVGDSAGKTSQFIGRVPWHLRGKPLAVTVPEFAFANKRFTVNLELEGSKDKSEMPIHAENEGQLLLTPGGSYTAEDVQANGNTTASAKFKMLRPRHDVPPKPGESICPVTLSRANPEFAWIVGGKRYRFCCPPCIDEFVLLAKELPEEIAGPETYVKKK